MSQETHTSESVAAKPQMRVRESVSSKDIASLAGAYAGILWNWVRHTSAIVWKFLHKKVFIPSAIFALAIFALAEKIYIAQNHRIRCNCHQIMAAISRVKARRLTGVVFLALLVSVLFSTAFYSFGIEVIIDGESLGYVISQADYQASVTRVQNRVSSIMGVPHSVNPNVTFSFGFVERDKILEGATLDSVLFSKIEGIEELYVLSVDGNIIGACRDQASIDAVLANAATSSDANTKRELLSDISVSLDAVDVSYLCTQDELSARLAGSKIVSQTHTVTAKDSVSSICKLYNMKRHEFRALNPGVDMSALVPGQEVIVSNALPILSTKELARVTESLAISYETTEVKDSSLYVGKKSIKTNGVKGEKQVVYDVTYVDGKETERTIVSETVVKQPVTEVVLVGTKPLPKKAATGTFRRPTGAAVISSNYGYRRSGFHTGVDFALAYGSPVYASDGGTVSFSGWKGGYGYLVIINHGNGKQTYYAHNSKLLVSAGDKVGKGEQIAKIGSTGNSTGPHCHFEIRVNGRHVNPWRYLS